METIKHHSEEEDNSKNKRRLVNNKFIDKHNPHATIHRDLVLPNFDRTLIVEKTHFENNEEQLSTLKSDPDTVVEDSSPPNKTVTSSQSVPNLTLAVSDTNNNNNNNNNNKRKISQKSEVPSRNHRKLLKKQSKNTMHGTASPAEVFHRNLVDAVSNVEDSDENEHYVYPYSGYESSTTNGIYRPMSVRSTPSLLQDKKSSSRGFTDWLRKTLYSKPQNHDFDEEDLYYEPSRPKLRNHVRDHPSKSNKSLFNLWRDGFNNNDKYASSNRSLVSSTQRKAYCPHYYNGTEGVLGGNNNNNNNNSHGGYTSDDEDTPLFSKRQKRSKTKKSWNYKVQHTLLLSVLLFCCIISILVYRAKPISDIYVDMGRVLATDKELIFDLKVQAENWNWWTIHVADADISVFAFSQIVPAYVADNGIIKGVDPAEYLGSLNHFDEPLTITSNLLHNHSAESITQIRIKSPGADASGSERWSRMIRYPYGLVVRGVLKYKLVPFMFGSYPQSIAICSVSQVDPTTGIVSSDLDKSFCSNQEDDTI